MQRTLNVTSSVFILLLFCTAAHGYGVDTKGSTYQPIMGKHEGLFLSNLTQFRGATQGEWSLTELGVQNSSIEQEAKEKSESQPLLFAKGAFGETRDKGRGLSFQNSRSQNNLSDRSKGPANQKHPGEAANADGTEGMSDDGQEGEKPPERGSMPPMPLPDPSGKMPILDQPMPLNK